MSSQERRYSCSGPLFKWFGSKWQNSRYYPSPHASKIIEPFGGGAGYGLRFSHCDVKLAETDAHISALWAWLIEDATQESVSEIPTDIPVGLDIRMIPMSKGQQLLLKNWQRTNNVGDCWTISPWGNMPGQWTENTRRRVSTDVRCVKHWELHPDGFELLESSLRDDSEITWFIDPVYMFNYKYKMKTEFDYERLSNAVCKLKGQVIVCEAVCPKTNAVPSYLPFTFFRNSVTSRRTEGANTHSKELMYYKAAS
jgi:hypothetical protein